MFVFTAAVTGKRNFIEPSTYFTFKVFAHLIAFVAASALLITDKEFFEYIGLLTVKMLRAEVVRIPYIHRTMQFHFF